MIGKFLHISKKQFELMSQLINKRGSVQDAELLTIISEINNAFVDSPSEIEYEVVSQHS